MLIQLWARDWTRWPLKLSSNLSDSTIPVLLRMSFHIPGYCTILWHLSSILDHPLAHLPVRIYPVSQLGRVRDPEPGQSGPESSLAANQAEEQRKGNNGFISLSTKTHRGALSSSWFISRLRSDLKGKKKGKWNIQPLKAKILWKIW